MLYVGQWCSNPLTKYSEEDMRRSFKQFCEHLFGAQFIRSDSSVTGCWGGFKYHNPFSSSRTIEERENSSPMDNFYFSPGPIFEETLGVIDEFNSIMKNIHIDILDSVNVFVGEIRSFGSIIKEIYRTEHSQCVPAKIYLFKISVNDKIQGNNRFYAHWATSLFIRELSYAECFMDDIFNDKLYGKEISFCLNDYFDINDRKGLSGQKYSYRSVSETSINVEDLIKLDHIYTINFNLRAKQTSLWQDIKTVELKKPLGKFRIRIFNKETGEYYGNVGVNYKIRPRYDITLQEYLKDYCRPKGAVFSKIETFNKINSWPHPEVLLEVYEIPDSTESSPA